MTEEQKAELARLAADRSKAAEAVRAFGYVNVAGRPPEELDDIARKSAALEAEHIEAAARLRAFMSRLNESTEREASEKYAQWFRPAFARRQSRDFSQASWFVVDTRESHHETLARMLGGEVSGHASQNCGTGEDVWAREEIWFKDGTKLHGEFADSFDGAWASLVKAAGFTVEEVEAQRLPREIA